MNPYQVLGLSENCTLNQIKETYRELSKVFHPDKQPLQNYQLSVETFELIDKAYKMINTPFHKMVYDTFGDQGITVILENQIKFQNLIKQYDEGKDVVAKIRSKIIKLKLEQYEKIIYSDILRRYNCTLAYDISQSTEHFQQFHAIQGIRLPKWHGFESEFMVTMQCVPFSENIKNKQIVYEKQLKINRVLNLPFLKLCQLKTDFILSDYQEFKVNAIIQKQLNENVNFEIVAQIREDGITPYMGIQLHDEQNNTINLSISGKNTALMGNYQVTPRVDINCTISASHLQTNVGYNVLKSKYYESYLRIILIQSTKQSKLQFQSQMKVCINKLNIDLTTSISETHYSIELHLSRFLSKYTIPLMLRPNKENSDARTVFLLFAIPQLIPLIWKYWQPNSKKDLKKRQQNLRQLEDLQKENEEVRQNLESNDIFQKIVQNETNNNGLIIIKGYLGETKYIEEYQKRGVVNRELVCVTEQLQQEVFDKGLLIPPKSFEKLDGFFKLEVRKDLKHYCGFVEYKLNDVIGKKLWKWNETLRIGNVADVNQTSTMNFFLRQ